MNFSFKILAFLDIRLKLLGTQVKRLALAVFAFQAGTQGSPQRAARAFYVGEAVKITVVVVLFVAVFRYLRITFNDALAMFLAYLATFFVYWAALATGRPGFSGTMPRKR